MGTQHTENLFRRYTGQLVSIKTVSGGIYQGRVVGVTNDYVAITEDEKTEPAEVFLFFRAIESLLTSSSDKAPGSG
jgi:ribosome maturation factor RimP